MGERGRRGDERRVSRGEGEGGGKGEGTGRVEGRDKDGVLVRK